MESPVRVQADLSEGVNAWLCAPIDAAKAIGTRLMEEWDYRRDSRRMRNIMESASLALPEIEDVSTAPDDDWMTEWFDLASKRSYQEWRHAMAKMLANEANEPGSVPLRYFVDMARLDKRVVEEFKAYCAWYVHPFHQIVKRDRKIPTYICEANLVINSKGGYMQSIQRMYGDAPCIPITINGWSILIKNGDYDLPIGNFSMTNFGEFVYDLLDPKPPLAPDLLQSLRELWKSHLYEP